jgi:hypothetical protein
MKNHRMGRPLTLALLLALPLAASAVAAQTAPATTDAEAMAGYFGNTLTISIPDMYSAKRYFAPDHTYTETGDDGDVHGTWAIKDGKVCTVQSQAYLDRLKEYCNLGVGRKPGETWVDHDPLTGNRITFTLIAGRVGAPS